MEQQQNQKPQRSWAKNTVMVKVGIITILMLLLLIPLSMIESIIYERENMNRKAIKEVSSKWSNEQVVKGPILTVPMLMERENQEGEVIEYIKYWYLLPKELKIDGDVDPRSLNRGIYDIIVYSSNLDVKGQFDLKSIPKPSDLKEIQLDKAFLTVGINDLRGIKNQIKVKWNDTTLDIEPGSRIPELVESGVTIPVTLSEEGQSKYDFSFNLVLQGSQNLSFIPLGATTQVSMHSKWDSPSFVGNFLPDTREVTEEGFTAKWTVLQLNRNFPLQWISGEFKQYSNFDQSAFGVDLLIPVNDYQTSMRSAKYGAMTIALTFLIFFLVEVINKTRIHPLQYAMVGIALCLFYTLLVSISEHSSFNLAFGIASVAIVSMISLYSLSLFKNKKLSLMLMLILFGIYTFLFITLQMVDYALLMGSIGLTMILGATMFYTRKINWYQLNLTPTTSVS
ncbi:cell envelope integrity protein CreD [Flammeovirga aprica]|uniref:Cell envelope integrity protein CreD n=1 Tax=Flammeovirga aprica JL-4 TaxID=694437 RepID=A0A7X9RT43_9BACT|nr:cell envelope integrity protein CreD [Flammeovirga aprica]NME67891.1 cell envelope integrity protein CreD [Flammeovirga aprica JL-4]